MMKRLTIDISTEMHTALKKIAAENMTTMTAIVIETLDKFITVYKEYDHETTSLPH